MLVIAAQELDQPMHHLLLLHSGADEVELRLPAEWKDSGWDVVLDTGRPGLEREAFSESYLVEPESIVLLETSSEKNTQKKRSQKK